MDHLIKIQGKTYTYSEASGATLDKVLQLKFSKAKLQELENQMALLQKAKKSYIDEITQEVLRAKSGL